MLNGVYSSGSVDSLVTSALKFFAASQCLLGEKWPNTATVANGSHFDFIIVGAGTAGSTLAARLAEVPNFTVLLVEAGGYPPQEAIIPGFRDSLKASPYDWNFTTVNDFFSSQGLENGRQVQPRGKILGGSNSINDMVYARGRPEDYEEWADIVGNTWNWTNVLDYFKKTERMTDERIINNDELMYYHGTDGEIEVSGRLDISADMKRILEAFEELGVPTVDDLTYPNDIGAGIFSHTISNGRRASSLTALLNKVRTDNLRVLTNTFVRKILINENGKAVGISALMNGEVVQFYADNEVIVSAGTFNTPKLLMLSGIGPKNHLESLGIPVVHDLPVGNNLHDHIMVINYLAINNGTCTVSDNFQNFQMIKYLYDSSGTFSYSDSAGVYLPKVGGDPRIPYFAIYPTCVPQSGITLDGCMNVLGYDKEVCQKITATNEKYELISLAVVHLKPQSRGAVRLNSTDPLTNPLIYSGIFSNDTDFDGYFEAIIFSLSLANTKYFKAQNARILDYSWDKCKTRDWTRCVIQDYAMPAWHAVGTAAMGTVVNAHLQVLGIENLRVVDAGVMPIIIRGNTNAAVVMIAEKAADFIKSAHSISFA